MLDAAIQAPIFMLPGHVDTQPYEEAFDSVTKLARRMLQAMHAAVFEDAAWPSAQAVA